MSRKFCWEKPYFQFPRPADEERFTRQLIEASRWSSSEAIGCVSSADYLSRYVMWTIDNFCDLPKVNLYTAISSVFHFAGQDWKLMLWPNFDSAHIELNLLRKGPAACGRNILLRFSFGLMRKDGTFEAFENQEISMKLQCKEWSCALTSRAFLRTLLQKEREALLPFGNLVLHCRLTVDRDLVVNTAKQVETADIILATLCRNLKDLYTDEKDCDVTIKVKNETFKAHRIILCARTPVLAAMFSHSMLETETGVICVEDCDPKAFRVFLLYVYSGSTENLTTENVMSVYYIADKYDLPQLKEVCVQYMLSNLTVDSVCSVISVASRHDEQALLEAASEFFLENAKEIFLSSGWEKFIVENTPEAKELIIRYSERK